MLSTVIVLLMLGTTMPQQYEIGSYPPMKTVPQSFWDNLACIFCDKDKKVNFRLDTLDAIDGGSWDTNWYRLISIVGGNEFMYTREYAEYVPSNSSLFLAIPINGAFEKVDAINMTTKYQEYTLKFNMVFVRHPPGFHERYVHLFACSHCFIIPKVVGLKLQYYYRLCIEGYEMTDNRICRKCKPGRWGYECKQKCQCADMRSCNPAIGTCGLDNCPIGRRGPSCLKECPKGLWGSLCLNECHCKGGVKCHAETGLCKDGCAPGYYGTYCWDKCAYGEFCAELCGCKDGALCNNVTGKCPDARCDARHRGENCTGKCPPNKFGEYCNETCHCEEPHQCNITNGRCEKGGCSSGWYGDGTGLCDKKCPEGDDDCGTQCRCKNITDCDEGLFKCPNGGCSARYHGKYCHQTCPRNYFMKSGNCSGECHCVNQLFCDVKSGECDEDGCEIGYKGPNCQTKSFGITSEVTIGIMMTIFTVIFIGIITLVMYKTVWNRYQEGKKVRDALEAKANHLLGDSKRKKPSKISEHSKKDDDDDSTLKDATSLAPEKKLET